MAANERCLSAGQTLVTAGGRRGTVGELLGAGGQGEVYRISLDLGLSFALKWYYPHLLAVDTTLRERLTRSIRRGAPTGDFLWPLDLVDIPGSGSFGYIMALRGADCISVRDLLVSPPPGPSFGLAGRARLCFHLATDFFELHANGFCYQDINFDNFFIDPATTRPTICDNDNVNVDGAEASIYGTRKFMAPEVVCRTALPSTRTDLYSMAVLFFYILFGWHPLDGRREYETNLLDAAIEMKLYGSEPVFIFDPADASNGPVPGVHDAIVARWRALPEALRRLFTRAFTTGLRDPAARVLEPEWFGAMRTVTDAAIACDGCGYEQVVAVDPRHPEAAYPCVACGQALAMPALLMISRRVVALTDGRMVAADALDPTSGDGEAPGARVEQHPRHPGTLGLRNLSAAEWRVALPGDEGEYPVAAGQAIRIAPGTTIRFGAATGAIISPIVPPATAAMPAEATA